MNKTIVTFFKFENRKLDEDYEVDDFRCYEMCSY
jgi:hypothetical protein